MNVQPPPRPASDNESDHPPGRGLAGRYLRHLAGSAATPTELIKDAASSDILAVAYSDRFLPTPVFLTAAQRESVAIDLLDVHRMLTQLPDRVFGGSHGALARAVGMTETQSSVVQRALTAPPLAPLARSDLYRTADGFKLLELNITSALGGFENAEINRSMLRHPALREFVDDHGLAYVDTLRVIVDSLLTECAAYVPRGRPPVVALADWPDHFPSYEPRLRVLATLLKRDGITAIPCHVGQITDRGGRLYLGEQPIDIIYRFFLVEEIATPADAEVIEPILRAVERGRVGLFSRLDAELYGNKGALALLSDDRFRSSLSPRERACVDRVLPWTRQVRKVGIDPAGQEVDLARHAADEQDQLILKPTLLHGGSGIVAGWTVGTDEWAAHVAAAMDGPYVLQRRVQPVAEPFPRVDRPGHHDLFLNWGIFVADPATTAPGGYGGCIVRGSTDPQVGVVSMGSGARVGCCFHETRARS